MAEEVVPGSDEREDRGGGQSREHQREDDFGEDFEVTAPSDRVASPLTDHHP
ncbi:hypothetical protein IWX64_001853 [Arthrobacter sp. CAN_A212]